MPKKAKELSAYQVRRLSKRPGKHAVGGIAGLLLEVKRASEVSGVQEREASSASWTFRVVVGDRRPDIGLGGYPDVTLEQAREQAREIRAQIRQGIDPLQARRAAQDALRAASAKRVTFDQAALACWRSKSQDFRNKKHSKQWLSTLTTYATPVIGNLPVDQIEVPHVVRLLEPHWLTKTESMRRVRGRVETVLEWARVAGYRNGLDNPASWKTLLYVLPKLSRIRKVKHLPALPWAQLPAFMKDLRARNGIAARALEFAILTAARSGEARLATWDELDLKFKFWTIPADRMKAGLVHRVPLSERAVALLKSLPRQKNVSYVFAAARGGPLSDMALSELCRRMHDAAVAADGSGYLDPTLKRVVVPHGFRSAFKDWCRSSTSYADEVSELALAHVSDDKTRAAYARDELLPKRTRLMSDWAKFCVSTPHKAPVTAIRGGRFKQRTSR